MAHSNAFFSCVSSIMSLPLCGPSHISRLKTVGNFHLWHLTTRCRDQQQQVVHANRVSVRRSPWRWPTVTLTPASQSCIELICVWQLAPDDGVRYSCQPIHHLMRIGKRQLVTADKPNIRLAITKGKRTELKYWNVSHRTVTELAFSILESSGLISK